MRDNYSRIEAILFRSWVMGFIILAIWFLAILFLSEQVLAIHSQIFGLTRHEFDLIMYCGMGLWKLVVILFFLIPWAAIRMTRD